MDFISAVLFDVFVNGWIEHPILWGVWLLFLGTFVGGIILRGGWFNWILALLCTLSISQAYFFPDNYSFIFSEIFFAGLFAILFIRFVANQLRHSIYYRRPLHVIASMYVLHVLLWFVCILLIQALWNWSNSLTWDIVSQCILGAFTLAMVSTMGTVKMRELQKAFEEH